MKSIEMVHNQFGSHGMPRIFSQLPTEEDILFLSDAFITHGFHCIQVQDINTGRTMINGFMQAMKMYHEVACLTVDTKALEPFIVNLYTELQENAVSTQVQCQEFILEHFYANFMWIELTPELQKQELFNSCISTIIDLKIDQHIPILIIKYQ